MAHESVISILRVNEVVDRDTFVNMSDSEAYLKEGAADLGFDQTTGGLPYKREFARVVNKLKRFPSSAALMELASYMRAKEMRTVVEWALREFNKEADQLANGVSDAFDPAKRLHVSALSLSWNILPEALEAGREAERAFQIKKGSYGLPNRCTKQAKRKVETRLNMTDPW